MAKTAQGLNREAVREVLKLAAWQVDLASDAGLIEQHSDGSYMARDVDLARDNLPSFRRLLEREYRISGADAARRLSCSLKEFNRLSAERRIAVVGETRGPCERTKGTCVSASRCQPTVEGNSAQRWETGAARSHRSGAFHRGPPRTIDRSRESIGERDREPPRSDSQAGVCDFASRANELR
jgi:hypothetical protein